MKKTLYLITIIVIQLILLVIQLTLFTGCTEVVEPAATIYFPGGAECEEGKLEPDVTAKLIYVQSNATYSLQLKVCLKCDGKPLNGVTGIIGELSEEAKEYVTQPQYHNPIPFDFAEGQNCKTITIPRVNTGIAGKEFTVKIVDEIGEQVGEPIVVEIEG
jgi:hypothetical protein